MKQSFVYPRDLIRLFQRRTGKKWDSNRADVFLSLLIESPSCGSLRKRLFLKLMHTVLDDLISSAGVLRVETINLPRLPKNPVRKKRVTDPVKDAQIARIKGALY